MPSISRTNEFKEAVKGLGVPAGAQKKDLKGKGREVVGENRLLEGAGKDDPWNMEANKVADNLTSLSSFLMTIRRPYLDLSSSSSHGPSSSKPSAGKGLTVFENARSLSDRDRDEVDLQVKVILKRCMERVREMEGFEKVRIAKTKPPESAGANSLLRMLGLPSIPSAPSSADQLAAHRTAIIHYLSKRLNDVGNQQKEMQEARVKRQMDRTSGLGGKAKGGDLGFGSGLGGFGGGGSSAMKSMGEQLAAEHKTSKGKMTLKSDDVPSIYKPATPSSRDRAFPHSQSPLLDDEEDTYEPPINSILTESQVQQFESEQSEMLKSLQTSLSSLATAQSSLLEISALQTELAIHLTQQAEMTDRLWEDAVEMEGRVGEGNKDLQRAKERNRESRIMLIVFLVGASLTLLFLDYYAS